MSRTVVILGAGVTGLSAGLDLAGRDCNVHILERKPAVGGLAGSFIQCGYTFDYGPHFFYTKDPEVYQRVKGLLKDALLDIGEIYRDIKIVFQGKEYDYPLTATSVLSNLDPVTLSRCMYDYAMSLVRRRFGSAPAVTFEDWVVSQFGRGLYEIFFRTYTEKTWGMPPSELAASFASERIPPLNPWKAIREAFRKKNASQAAVASSNSANLNHSYYPQKGCWQIPEAMRIEIESKGGAIHLDSHATKIVLENGRPRKVVYETNGQVAEIEADTVISTIPITELAGILEPIDANVKRAGLSMKYRELTLLMLRINKPSIFEARFVYFHDPNVFFQRVGEMKVLSQETVPSKDKTSLVVEITDRFGLPDAEIYRRAMASFEQLGLLREADIEGYDVVRQPHSYPIYDVGYRERLRVFMDGISKLEGLFLCGRQALFRYVDMYQCMRMGMVVASQVLGKQPAGGLDNIVAQWGKS